MSSVMVTAASTMCTTMSCIYALSSALSLLVARPSAAPSKLEMAALLCLGVSRVPSVDEKSIRPLATCEAIICRSTQSPTESMSFVIATESVSTEASAAAQAKLPSASLDSHADWPHMSSSSEARSSCAASSAVSSLSSMSCSLSV